MAKQLAITGSLFNKNYSDVKGLEKAIYLIADFTIKANASTVKVFYGSEGESKGPIDKALKKGLIPIFKEISSVDFCNLITYLVSQTTGNSGFNPNKPPETEEGRELWLIQKEAFELQLFIDKNLGQIADVLTPDSTLRLTDLLNFTAETIQTKINVIIEEFQKKIQSEQQSVSDGQLNQFIKVLRRLNKLQFILSASSDILSALGSNLNIGNAQKAINTLNKVRQTLILIQAINNPGAALALVNQVSGGLIQDQISKISQIIPIDKLIPLLNKCLKQAKNINSTGQKILGQIRTIQFFIKIAVVVIKVFSVIKTFFTKGFQLPNLYTTVSVTTTVSNIVEESLGEGTKKLILRLEQINYTLGLIVNYCTFLLAGINEILILLNAIKLNIESCQNVDDDLKQEINNTINSLSSTRDQLQTFINAVNSPINRPDTTFGGYTIEIITEQVVDEAINLRRRYGIARGKNNIIAVQSTPTFASLDLIIINEVKTLLVAQGLVKASPLGLTVETLSTISESLNYLEDQSITADSLQPDVDADAEDGGLGVQDFVNNLPGGRKLRRRVRNRLIKNNEKLIKDLKSADPTLGSNEKLIKQKQTETNKLKIEKLEDQKSDLQKLLLLSPALAPAIIIKIKAIDREISELKNKSK